ncbi:protein adenylyltransferase SelO family protein, partial [Bdellovibrionota bacterium FG-2]
WNGEFQGKKGICWDVTSSGTGATCLSPAAAQSGRNYRTGDKRVGYGNGYNTLDEGIAAALMSEIFHQNEVKTERTLLIIGFSGEEEGTSINVRVGQNLLRPSHLFGFLKQNRRKELKGAVDYYIAREQKNGNWPKLSGSERDRDKYRFFADETAKTFAQAAALFESEYIFCWMEWDGDNILANGGIIDYGSVRQFGMYYGDYRYDDVDRFSTSLPEQRLKARYIVQNFAQMRDFLLTGEKKNIRKFRNDPTLKIFDQEFEQTSLRLLLEKTGFSARQVENLVTNQRGLVQQYKKVFQYFERVRSKRGIYTVPDGENRDAVFCMRDFLREYPKKLLTFQQRRLSAEELVSLMAAKNSKSKDLPKDLKISPFRNKRLGELQELYSQLIRESSAKATSLHFNRILLELVMRSSVINKKDRITGDAAVLITENLIRWHKVVRRSSFHEAFEALVEHHQKSSTARDVLEHYSRRKTKTGDLVLRNLRLIRKYSESL